MVKVTVRGAGVEIDPSTFDISKFKALIDNYHKTSHFQMFVWLPSILNNVTETGGSTNLSTVSKNLMFDIEKVVMPGVSFATEDIRRQGYGFIERQPYSPIMETINCIVRSDASGKNYDFFQTWMKSIMNYQIEDTIDSPDQHSIGSFNPYYYELNYKNDPTGGYASRVDIAAINETSNAAIQISLVDAYPIYIGDINLDWADTNNIVKFPVKLTYSYWKQSRYYSSNNSSNTTG